MINRNSKKLLKFLRHSSPASDGRTYTYHFIFENYNDTKANIYATVRFLEKEGYLEFASVKGKHVGVILTETALHPYQFTWAVVKSFLIKSVAVPVVTSVATTLITLWLKSLL